MKIHNLHILKEYADEKIKGNKLFEIRENDKKYEVGDIIKYKVITNEHQEIEHKLNKKYYKIVFITNFAQKENYIVFGEKKLNFFSMLKIIIKEWRNII